MNGTSLSDTEWWGLVAIISALVLILVAAAIAEMIRGDDE